MGYLMLLCMNYCDNSLFCVALNRIHRFMLVWGGLYLHIYIRVLSAVIKGVTLAQGTVAGT